MKVDEGLKGVIYFPHKTQVLPGPLTSWIMEFLFQITFSAILMGLGSTAKGARLRLPHTPCFVAYQDPHLADRCPIKRESVSPFTDYPFSRF